MELKLGQQLEELFREIARDEIRSLLANQFNQQVFLDQKDNLGDRSYLNKIGWLIGDDALLNFHEQLTSHGFIVIDFESFKLHFKGNGNAIPIIWLSHTNRLVYLFDRLADNFIPEPNYPHQLLKIHFRDKHGREFKDGCLRSSLNQASAAKNQVVEDILKVLENNKS